MNPSIYLILLTLGALTAALLLRAWHHLRAARREAEAALRQRDDFMVSIARYGYVHDGEPR